MFIDEQENIEVETTNNPFGETEEIVEQTQDTPTEETKVEQEEVSETDKLKAELEDLNNKYLRMAADFDNYRKRQAQERENLLKYGAQDTMEKLLIVLDTIERARESLKDVEDVENVKNSYEMAFKQLFDVLNKAGLEKITAVGEIFDPNLHEAILQTPTNEHPDNTIIIELQSGYKLLDRVLRAALVNVAVSEG